MLNTLKNKITVCTFVFFKRSQLSTVFVNNYDISAKFNKHTFEVLFVQKSTANS